MTSKKITRTYCAQCFSNCPVKAETENGRFIKASPDTDHVYYRPLCPKGTAAPEIVNSPARLKYPMKRTNPKDADDPDWETISWEEALNTVSEKMKEIRDKYGAETIAFSQTNVSSPLWEVTAFVRRLANLYGTPNHITTTHICNWHRDNASALTFGKPGDSFSAGWPDMENSRCAVIWGHNPKASMNAYYRKLNILRMNGLKVIVIDPRRTEVAEKADLWLKVKPGTDGALALGMINLMLDGMYDEDFTASWTNAPLLVRKDTGNLLKVSDVYGDRSNGSSFFTVNSENCSPIVFDPEKSYGGKYLLEHELTMTMSDGSRVECATVFSLLKESAANYTPERVEELTDIPPTELENAVRLITENSPSCWFGFNGIEQNINATQTNRAICTLYALTGDYDKKGGNILCSPVPQLDNPFGFEFVTPDTFEKNIALKHQPIGPAASSMAAPPHILCESIEKSDPYKIRGLIVFGSNIVSANPNSRRIADAIKKLEFYVHIDLFPNPTMQSADIVLPAASFWETGRIGYPMSFNTHDSVLQWREPVAEAQGESRDDLWIIFQLADKLGLSDKFWDGNIADAFEAMLKPTGYTLSDLKKAEGGILIKKPELYQKYKTSGFNNMTRRIELFSQHLKDIGQQALPSWENPYEIFHKEGICREQYPFILTNAKVREYCQSQHRRIATLRRKHPHPFIEINTAKAEELNIADGETVILETVKGKIRLSAKLTDRVAPNVVCTQHGWWEDCPELNLSGHDIYSDTGANVNLLYTDDITDPVSGSIQLRGFPCNITTSE